MVTTAHSPPFDHRLTYNRKDSGKKNPSNKHMNTLIKPMFSDIYWIGGGSIGLLLLIVLIVLLLRRA